MIRFKIQESVGTGAFRCPVTAVKLRDHLTVTSLKWKGVLYHDRKLPEYSSIRCRHGFRIAESKSKYGQSTPTAEVQRSRWVENLPDSNRQNTGQWRVGHRTLTAADGSSAVQLRSRRRIYGGLVRPSLSTATVKRGGRNVGSVISFTAAIPRNSGCFSGHPSGTKLPRRNATGIAGTLPHLWTERPTLPLDTGAAVGRSAANRVRTTSGFRKTCSVRTNCPGIGYTFRRYGSTLEVYLRSRRSNGDAMRRISSDQTPFQHGEYR